ncbi:MAG: hypothetical protein NXY57DRAFT_983402 [Lentinula lateritia]|nr:MAG: hypothetical protein NXY57DRAFT_983402 [Lentinula lateritia]
MTELSSNENACVNHKWCLLALAVSGILTPLLGSDLIDLLQHLLYFTIRLPTPNLTRGPSSSKVYMPSIIVLAPYISPRCL